MGWHESVNRVRLAASKSTDAGKASSAIEATLHGRADQQRTVCLNEISRAFVTPLPPSLCGTAMAMAVSAS